MKDEDVRNLLGGFATDTLSESERELLFGAALHDQELFNALADDQALREFLADPLSRRRLLQALQPDEPGVFERLTGWMRRPAVWAVAGSVMAALLVMVAIRHPHPPPIDVATTSAPAPSPVSPPPMQAPPQAPAPQHSVTLQDAPLPKLSEERRSRRDSLRREIEKPVNRPAANALPAESAPPPPAAPKAEMAAAAPAPAPPSTRLKVAVIDFDSAASAAIEADTKSSDVGKEASELLKSKLDSSGYTIIDNKQVDKALQAQNLTARQLDPAAAATVGRSVGADAVILGSVALVKQPALAEQNKAFGGLRAGALSKSKVATDKKEVQVTARAINTQKDTNPVMAFAQGEQSPGGGLATAVDQVASSLGQQMQQNARLKIEGLVTDVNAAILTLNLGAKTGIKTGDRLEVRRTGKVIGHIVLSTVKDAFSVGAFEGSGPAKIGDTVTKDPTAP